MSQTDNQGVGMTFSLADIDDQELLKLNDHGRALLQEWLTGCLQGMIESIEILDQRTYRNGATMYIEIKVFYNGQKAKTTRIYPTAINVIATLHCDGVTYLALVKQFRSAIGTQVIGNPGGRMEQGSTVFETALRECNEELSLPRVTWSNPIDLTEAVLRKGCQGSPGTAHEQIRVVHIGATITSEQFAEFQGHQAGLIAEGEQTTVHLVPIDDVTLHLRDFPGISMKMLGALWLYEMALRMGIIS